LVGAGLLVLLLGSIAWEERSRAVERHRDFYGAFRILEQHPDDPASHARVFTSGGTIHGAQFQSPVKAAWPTTYYDRDSGIGIVLDSLPPDRPRRIGVVGLGVGTLAAYARPGDVMRFYELNPYVAEVARTRFSYLARSAAEIEVALGDARLSLEREPPQAFDVLVLDAFTSDAIPVHLLTREAFEVYRRHLKPTGVLAAHLSNRHLDLAPVVRQHAARWGIPMAEARRRPAEIRLEAMPSHWMILTWNVDVLVAPGLRTVRPDPASDGVTPWTDEHVSLWPLLKGGRRGD
jgi:SAM-dependent methyltransferase